MKKWLIISLAVLALAGPMTSAIAAPLDDKLAVLKEAIKSEIADKESKSPVAGEPMNPRMAAYQEASAEIMQLNFNGPGGSQNIEATVQQILTQFSSDAVQKAGQDVLDEIRREREAKEEAYAAAMNEGLKRIPNIVLKASTPSDLDPLLVDLQKLQRAGRDDSEVDQAMQRESQRAMEAYQFVAVWQDYLSDRASRKVEQAQNELRNLAQNTVETWVPRSDILDRVRTLVPGAPSGNGTVPPSSEAAAKQIAESIQSLDEMAPALLRIKALPITPGDLKTQQLIQALEIYVSSYLNAKAGLPVTFQFTAPIFQASSFENPQLYKKLWLFSLEHEFDAFKGSPPVDSESPLQFLDRVFTDAEQRQDWHELQQAYLAHAYLDHNSLFSTGTGPNDTVGFDLMLAGLNQETATQYQAAVLSYEQALKTHDTYLPAQFIGDRLNRIEKDHPEDYARGLELAGLAPSAVNSHSSLPASAH